MDLIHKGELFNRLAGAADKAEIFAIVQAMEPVDAVEVVRCRDCKYKTGKKVGGYIQCKTTSEWHDEIFYCANGERKT